MTRPNARADCMARSRKQIPFCGIFTTRRIVKCQRYLAAHGLPHSARVAAVFIGRQR